jgi:mono/diheme cytochrome c family protein
MDRLRWFVLGIILCTVTALLAAALVLQNVHGFSASRKPTAVETWMARWARSAALPTDARARINSTPNTREVLEDARAHWADHCATCHANDGSGDTFMGRHTYPPAPDMRLPATQRMTDGELFYIIQNGIRLTAMPAWGGESEHDALDSWKLVRFIRHLPNLTDEEKAQMEKLNPKSPAELKEEEGEERFLKGEDSNEQTMQHHHR